eukprot:Nk52_evm1s15 gene=Nk52_evmTU1s15
MANLSHDYIRTGCHQRPKKSNQYCKNPLLGVLIVLQLEIVIIIIIIIARDVTIRTVWMEEKGRTSDKSDTGEADKSNQDVD